VDHLLLPLDPPHIEAVERVAEVVSTAAHLDPAPGPAPHITLLAYDGLPRDDVERVLRPIVTRTAPFQVNAHGYGLFTGGRPQDLCLFVTVARCAPLERGHSTVFHAMEHAGARVSGADRPSSWLPHVTVVDRGLDACTLGVAVASLAGRGHPRWHIPIDCVVLAGGRQDRSGDHVVLPFGVPAPD
jgi:hypothetical protein